MSLSKQLYGIISIIFLIIFAGNFIISVKNTKEYLEIESTTKAQDTATSLGLSLKPLIKDKFDPEIESIINAISNSGFYKEIRLEDADFVITERELIEASTDLDDSSWEITDISINKKFGRIEKVESDEDMNQRLALLENDNDLGFSTESVNHKFRYVPSEAYKNGGNITFDFKAKLENKTIDTFANLTINRVIYEDTRPVKFEYVPKWFINLIPISMEEKSSEISNGWNTTAVIYVSSNPGDAYDKLYQQAKNTIVYTIIAFILSMLILLVFVQYLLKPLKRIESLAKNISQGKFGTIAELPWTTEIKNVAIAMNEMSTKIESIIGKLNSNLEVLSKRLSEDSLTGLNLKETFETDMKDMFIHKSSGYVFSIKIDELARFAKIHSNSEVNKYIQAFAKTLKEINKDPDMKISSYRVFGSEFLMLARNANFQDAKKIASTLQTKFEALSEKFNQKEIAHIGAIAFNPFSTIPEMLQGANEAYEKAKQIGPNECFIADGSDVARDMEEWRDLIFEIIDNSNFQVEYINDAYKLEETQNSTLLMQEAFTSAKDKDEKSIPIGTFVSIAEKYEKIVEFDKAVINKVLQYMIINSIKHDISINLSLDSITNDHFISWLDKTINANKNVASQLVFSITAYSVAKDIDAIKKFCDQIHEMGAKIIIKRFETKFIPIDNIKDFNLDYIRLARNYTCNMCEDTSKKQFVESINELANLLNIRVFAENVKDEQDYDVVKTINIYGASR